MPKGGKSVVNVLIIGIIRKLIYSGCEHIRYCPYQHNAVNNPTHIIRAISWFNIIIAMKFIEKSIQDH